MKSSIPVIFLTIAGMLALAGCDSMSDRVHERFARVEPKSRSFAGDAPTVGAAVKLAFKRLDFTVTSSTGNISRIEASGRIRHDETLGDSRQLVAEVSLEDAGPGQTEVKILLTEEVETGSPGGQSSQKLGEHGFYDTFFETLQQVLAGQNNAASPANGG